MAQSACRGFCKPASERERGRVPFDCGRLEEEDEEGVLGALGVLGMPGEAGAETPNAA